MSITSYESSNHSCDAFPGSLRHLYRPPIPNRKLGKAFHAIAQSSLLQSAVDTHISNVGPEMMEYSDIQHSSRAEHLNGEDNPEILFELNTTWTAPEMKQVPPRSRLSKTVLTRFECYGEGKGIERKEAGVVLLNSLALTAEAREIITERYPGEWHTGAEQFLDRMAALDLVGTRCGSLTFDGTGALEYRIGHPEVIIEFPTLWSGDHRGVFLTFTKKGLTQKTPQSPSIQSSAAVVSRRGEVGRTKTIHTTVGPKGY